MSKRFVDPFFPNRPVDDPNRFAGRVGQVDEAIDALFQVANGNPVHTIITGERGIGKSSLLFQIRKVALGDTSLPDRLSIDVGTGPFDFVCASHDAAADQDVGRLASGLLQDLQSRVSQFAKQLRIEVNLGGLVTIGQKASEDVSIGQLVNAFCAQVGATSKKIDQEGKSGLLFFVDELDRLPVESGIATFFKLATERLAREGFLNVGFVCAGIAGAVQQMEKEHASIFRVFKDVLIPRLTEAEVEQILTDGFEAVGKTYTSEVVKSVVGLCAGFPEPVHLLGSEMVSVDSDDMIDGSDLSVARVKVVQEVRKNALYGMLQKAGSGRYQEILGAMASYDGHHVPLAHISDALSLQQNQFSVNMGDLIKKGLIVRPDRGVYAFVDPLLKEYISVAGTISYDS